MRNRGVTAVGRPPRLRRGYAAHAASGGEFALAGAASAPRSARAQPESISSTRLSLAVTAFLFAQLIPWEIMLGSLRISVYRLVLIALIFPCISMWLSGKAGRIRAADIFIICYAAWCAIAITVVHGFGYAVQPAGIIFVESVGPYLLARCFIRNDRDFYNLVRILFLIVAALFPFALFESFTGRDIARDFLSLIYPTFPDAPVLPRWGLRRAQVVYEHPILYGVVVASVLALVHLVLGYRDGAPRRLTRTGIVAVAAFLSLSAGPLSALLAQGILLFWNGGLSFVKQRWKILLSFMAVLVIALQFLSNRSVPAIFISYFSFDEGSAYARLNIWNYGTQSVMNNPLFGVGFNEWERPSWMSPSIDMFWLIDAIRHGIPAEAFMVGTFFATVLPVVFKRITDERLGVCRTAYLIAMTGLFISGWTVYFWNATFVLMMFLLGSGVWLRDIPDAEAEVGTSGRNGRQTREIPRIATARYDFRSRAGR